MLVDSTWFLKRLWCSESSRVLFLSILTSSEKTTWRIWRIHEKQWHRKGRAGGRGGCKVKSEALGLSGGWKRSRWATQDPINLAQRSWGFTLTNSSRALSAEQQLWLSGNKTIPVALADLRGHGGGEENNHFLFVQSSLIEYMKEWKGHYNKRVNILSSDRPLELIHAIDWSINYYYVQFL